MSFRLSFKYLHNISLRYCEQNLIYFSQISRNFSLKLFLLDEISKTLCEISDKIALISVFLRSSPQLLTTFKEKPASFEEFEQKSQEIQGFLSELNKNSMIYNHLLAMKFHENFQFLNAYEQQFLEKILEDYEIKYGISSQAQRVSELFSCEEALKAEFEQNIYENQEVLSIEDTFSSEITNKLSIFQRKYRENRCFIEFSCNFKQILKLVFHAKTAELKKKLFSAYFNANKKNLETLVSLLKTRGSYAFLIKPAESFAELSLRTSSMLRTAVSVSQLQEILINESVLLNNRIKTLAKKENPLNIVDLFESVLEESRSNKIVRISLENAMNFLQEFFEIYTCLKLRWKFAPFAGISQKITTVRFELLSAENSHIIAENSHIAENSIGEIEIILNDFDCTQTMISQGNSKYSFSKKLQTKPRLFLLFDFFKARKIEELSLSFQQISKIAHEFSHALHNILSFHEFQYISCNTKLDYAEFVATLFENLFAKHLENTQNLSENSAISLGNAVTQLEQLYFSLLDLRFHSEKQFFSQSFLEISSKLQEINAETFRLLFKNYEFCEDFSKNSYYCSMLHLTTYASAYYSYALGEILSKELLRNREFSHETLKKKLTKILTLAHKEDVFYLILKEIGFNH